MGESKHAQVDLGDIRRSMMAGPDGRLGHIGADILGITRRDGETAAEAFTRALNERAERTPEERAAPEMLEAHRWLMVNAAEHSPWLDDHARHCAGCQRYLNAYAKAEGREP